MKNKQAKQMIEQTQGVLFIYEQRVRKGKKPSPCVVLKNDNRALGMLLNYGYGFNR